MWLSRSLMEDVAKTDDLRFIYPRGTFDALAGRDEIPRYKRGAGWRYYRDELTEWLRQG